MAEKTGSRMPRANVGYLLSLKVPVPSPAEQRRIAASINAKFTAVEKVKKAAGEQWEVAKNILGVSLQNYFSEKCKSVALEDVLYDISYGYTASADFDIHSPKLLRITDIQDGNVEWGSVPGCNTDKDVSQYYLNDGDIVIARTGGTIGKTFLISSPPMQTIFASYLIRLSFHIKKILPQYVYLFFNSDYYWRQLRGMSQGTGQPNVNTASLKRLQISIVSIEDQKNIVKMFSLKIKLINKLCLMTSDQLFYINALPAAILRKAFKGEL
jgi:type I restriction enzyme S subunit